MSKINCNLKIWTWAIIFYKPFIMPIFLFLFLSFTVIPAFSDTIQPINPQQTENKITETVTNQEEGIKDQAAMWGLSADNFQHYLWLMKNTPSGHWYKNLDPPEVLALNTKNSNEMMQYAKIQAQNMHSRVTRELTFDEMYSQAYKQLYPNEKAITSPNQSTQDAALKSGDRVWLFVGVGTPLGSFAYQHLNKMVEATSDTVLDIYFIGKHVTQTSIQRWAASMAIAPNLVNKKITLNFGNDRFDSLTKGKKVNLPFVGIVHDNHFQPITLSSVL
ncbi:MAG: TIGR03759 family integrating conjugative element protein [Coxiellaceae bacterium]|nr:TIGR03759 family integrating conjugative element protein [Coxiellaceae bacterium]